MKSVTFRPFTEAALQASPNPRAIAEAFGRETGDVLALVQRHEGKIGSLLANAENGTFTLDGKVLRKELFNTTRDVPEGWAMGSFPKGSVFLNTVLTPSLEAEGFARELIRRAQQLRKEAGLRKHDVIVLGIEAPELASSISAFEKELCGRTGAASLHLGEITPGEKWTHRVTARIKGKDATIALKKATKHE